MQKVDGRLIRNLREERGYSLRTFAEMIYVSKSSLQRWEKSFVPANDDVLNRIAEVFGMTTEELLAQSRKRYGESTADDITPDELVEVKYGVKRLILLITIVCIFGITTLVLPLFLSCLGLS